MSQLDIGVEHYTGHDTPRIVPVDDVARGGHAHRAARALRCHEQHDVHESCLWHQLVYYERLGITEFQSVNRRERAVAHFAERLLFDAVRGRSNRKHVLFQRGMVVVTFGGHLGVIGLIDLQYSHTHAE